MTASNLSHVNLKAATLARLGDFEEAIALYDRCWRARPTSRACG